MMVFADVALNLKLLFVKNLAALTAILYNSQPERNIKTNVFATITSSGMITKELANAQTLGFSIILQELALVLEKLMPLLAILVLIVAQ
jgi:hypothetical protein